MIIDSGVIGLCNKLIVMFDRPTSGSKLLFHAKFLQNKLNIFL